MSSKRHAPKGKKINPHFWMFCEGETEEAYIRYLRSEYRLPVEIIPKVAGCDIDERYIKSYKKGKPILPWNYGFFCITKTKQLKSPKMNV